MHNRMQFVVDFGLKSSGVIALGNERGLKIEGWATRFNEIDQEGEWTDPESFSAAAKTFFDNSLGNGPVPILFHHGLDRTLGSKRLGRILDYKIDDVGVWISAFLPEPPDGLTETVARKTREVWEGVRDGSIAGLSIGGVFGKLGNAIKSVALYEVSITPAPCLPTATFSLAQKSLGVGSLPAIDEATGVAHHTLDVSDPHAFVSGFQTMLAGIKGLPLAFAPSAAVPMPGEPGYSAGMGASGVGVGSGGSTFGSDGDGDGDDQPCGCTCPGCTMKRAATMGVDWDGKSTAIALDSDSDAPDGITYGLERDDHARAMGVALAAKSAPLHDHLLNTGYYPVEAQSDHVASACPVCDYRRWLYGIKGTVSTKPWSKVDKTTLPRAAFLDQGEPDKPSTWRYPVYEGSGPKGSDGRYTQRGALNKNAVANATARATQQGETAILKKLAPLRAAAGFDGDKTTKKTGRKGNLISQKSLVESKTPQSVTPLAPAELAGRMTALAAAAPGLAELYAQLEHVSGDGHGDAVLGRKAGRKLSKATLSYLRDYHAALRETVEEYGSWLDAQFPTTTDAGDLSSHEAPAEEIPTDG